MSGKLNPSLQNHSDGLDMRFKEINSFNNSLYS